MRSRVLVPFMIILYGLILIGLRLFVLDTSDHLADMLLGVWTTATACLCWVIEVC